MTITRTSLADTIDEYDQMIADANEGKRETFAAYREQLAADGMSKDDSKAELAGCKVAIKRRRQANVDPMAVESREILVDEIFEEIYARTRTTHERFAEAAE